MKKYAKKATALAMAAAMAVMATPVHASEPSAMPGTNVSDTSESTQVDGENTVVAPVYKVTLPTSIPFAVDAFELGGGGSSLYSRDYAIVNRSNVPVLVTATFNVTGANGTTLVATEAGVANAATEKNAFLQMSYAEKAAEDAVISSTETKPHWVYNPSPVLQPLTTTDGTTVGTGEVAYFLLDSANYPIDPATGSVGKTIAATNGVNSMFNAQGFKIVGKVTTYPADADGALAWEAGDVVVTAVFDILGETTSDYFKQDLGTKNPEANAMNYFKKANKPTADGTIPTAATMPVVDVTEVVVAATDIFTAADGTVAALVLESGADDALKDAGENKIYARVSDTNAATPYTYRQLIDVSEDSDYVLLSEAEGLAASTVASGATAYMQVVKVNWKNQVLEYTQTTMTAD